MSVLELARRVAAQVGERSAAPICQLPPCAKSAISAESSPWPHAAEAEQLLAAHRAELGRLERELFRGGFPPVLPRVLAIGRKVANRFIRDHAPERARGWDSLELLRGLLADEVRMVRRMAAEGSKGQ